MVVASTDLRMEGVIVRRGVLVVVVVLVAVVVVVVVSMLPMAMTSEPIGGRVERVKRSGHRAMHIGGRGRGREEDAVNEEECGSSR